MTRSVFMGTPPAAVPILDAVVDVTDVRLVVTRPDRPRGRSSRPEPPAVKLAALDREMAVAQPADAATLHQAVREAEPDVVVVAAYGRLIRPDLLAVPSHGFVNVHFSLLPRWRGASPVARAILAGDAATGVSLIVMDEGLDTGPVLDAVELGIDQSDTTGSLTAELADLGAEMIRRVLPRYVAGEVHPEPQDDAGATAAGKIETSEAFVDPRRHSAAAVERAIRAFDPRPGAWSVVDGERIKFWRAEPSVDDSPPPGVAESRPDGVLLGTPTGAVRLLEVQPAGKGRMSAEAWMNGRRGEPARFSRP